MVVPPQIQTIPPEIRAAMIQDAVENGHDNIAYTPADPPSKTTL